MKFLEIIGESVNRHFSNEEAVYLTKYGSHVHLIVRSKALKASQAK